MSKPIIGVTVGTTTPRANLMQTDPSKADYVKGKEEFLKHKHSWKDMTDRPVVLGGAGDTVSWDGNTDGMVSIMGGLFAKVSDVVLTAEDLADGCVFHEVDQDGNAYVYGGLDPGDAQNLMEDDGFLSMGCQTFVVPYAGYNFGGIVFTEAGIWMQNPVENIGPGWTQTLTVHGFTGFATEKFDPAYLYQSDWAQEDETAVDFIKNKPDIEAAVMDVLLALGLAPVLLDADGSVLTENDGTLLLI